MKALRIASFPTPTVNPYFGLYYEGLARFGVQVDYFRDITRAPLLTGPTGRLVDAVHFHWNLEKIWRSSGRSTLARLKGLAKWYRFLRRTKRAGVKILWTAHELAPPEGGTWSDRLGFLMCARAADLCISHSESSRQLVIRKFRLAADKTITIPHGNYDGVLIPTKTREAARLELGLPLDCRLLVCFGYQRPRKGLEVALDAMRLLDGNFHLVVQASGVNPKLKTWLSGLEEACRASNVSFLRRELDNTDLANLLTAADCVVLPYLEIVGSGALAACLTLGRAVVVSDLPYFRESLAEEPDAGVFFRPGNAADLAAAVNTFFAMDVSRREAAASRLADGLQWEALVTPIGEWLQSHRRSSPEETVD